MNINDMIKPTGKKLLMTHLVAGFPTERQSLKLAKLLVKSGADILEVQIPFSDPIADGEAIVGACHQSIRNGFTALKIFNFIKKLRKLDVPIVVMTYANIPFKIGIDKFVRALNLSGASGLIVPDLPFDSEEAKKFFDRCREQKINLIQVISPGIYKTRLVEAVKMSEGFIYCTTRKGTTGKHFGKEEGIKYFLRSVRQISDKPIALGFGISTPKDIKILKKQADILIIGSAIVKMVSNPGGLNKVSGFIKSIRRELDSRK